MKTRERQRRALAQKLLAEKLKEELLEYRDCCGIPDPTPYEAVKNCLRREQSEVLKRMAEKTA